VDQTDVRQSAVVHILLAEDNPGDILLVQLALREHRISHELHVVRDGEAAVAFAATGGQPGGRVRPDVILLDMNLPKMDGPAILSEFRKHAWFSPTRVIAISSSDAQKDRAEMAALGVEHYFKKPSDLYEFLLLGAVVREVMEQEHPAPAGQP